jgi:hypothetical protein
LPQGNKVVEANVHWLDLLGFAAAAVVLAGFCMNSILNLRMMVPAGNVLFPAARIRGAAIPSLSDQRII